MPHALGAPLLRVTTGQAHPGVTRADGIRWAAEGLARLVPHARSGGVTLAYENHTKASVFRFLKRTVGYDGWISVEEFSRTGGRGFREAVRFVREAWARA